ncbi:MAG TPA: hypothetical protein VGR78_04530 [Verrucomicrobiae bacterium]|jgi:chromosome segregation ATPase|nr:hypothetical protein [Verrucomicrobiae bacterium]
MSDLHLIESTLVKTAQRRRLERGFRRLWQGLLAGAVIWLVILGVYKLAPIPEVWARLSWLILPASAVLGFFWGWSRPVTLNETARWIDSRRQLQERLSTALEISRAERNENWKALVLADAAKSISKLNLKDLLPLRLPPASRWALLALVLGAGLGFVPEYRTKAFVQKKQDADAIKQTGRELANLTKHTLQARPPAIETTKKALEEVQELGNQMAKAQLTRGDALKDLANVTEKLKEQTRDLAKNPAIRNLERAARSSSSKGGTPSADLQQKLEAMAKQNASNAANPEALEKLKSDVEKAKEMAANMPKGDGQEAKDAKDKLNATLADLAKQAKNLGADLPSLSEAIAALQNSMPDQVLKDLQVAEIELEKMEAMAKALEKMQVDAQKLGKDLAEQLRNGQAEAAESTLRKMQAAMQAGKISPEDLEKMMKEVGQALDPAKQYAEVGDHLQAAMKGMQKGAKAQAGESLGKAADALARMSSELGDAQSLLATLEALQQAQMCLANGQGFGDKPSASMSRYQKGTSKGGVGTWHDEDSWAYPEFVEKWDNSGVERPDMDGKGVSDRGDGQLADNLAPTKIKGQITPGGPMPSVTMKGISIKGNSKVQFQEMAASAQSDAQSALNQDQVPRAYQNAVRNYFDDLKE